MRASESIPGVTIPEHAPFNYDDAAPLRGNLYRFLAGAYLNPPEREFVAQLLDTGFIQQAGFLLGEEVVAPLLEIEPAFDDNDALMALQQEYMELFVVPTGRYVTPFEDVYRGLRQDGKQERGPLLGNRAVDVKVTYRSAGADLDKTCKELPTHIGVELSFMAYLCEQEEHATDTVPPDAEDDLSEISIYRLWQLKFLHEHLTDWFPQLNKTIQANARTPFYRCLAQFTGNFLDHDKTGLKRQLEFDLQPASRESEAAQ